MPYVLAEVSIALCAIAVEAVLFLACRDIPIESSAYPQGLIILAFILSVIFLLQRFVQYKRKKLAVHDKTAVTGSILQVLALCGMIALYLLLLKPVGYLIMTPLFILGTMLFFGMRKPLALILTTAVITGFTYYMFNYVLYVFLPRGILG